MIYKNMHDKYKIATIILSIISAILLIACLFLIKFGLDLKDQLLLCTDALSEIETQVSQFQTGTVQMSEEYNKLVTELTTATTTIETQKKQIQLLEGTVESYKEQINTLMGVYNQQSSQTQPNNQQVPSSLSMPSLGIDTNTSPISQQSSNQNNSTNSNNTQNQSNNPNFNVVTID